MLMVPFITKTSVKTQPSKDTWVNESQSPGSACSSRSAAALISMTSEANNNDLVDCAMFCQRTRGHMLMQNVTYQLLATTPMKHSNLLFENLEKFKWHNRLCLYLYSTIEKPLFQGVFRYNFRSRGPRHYWLRVTQSEHTICWGRPTSGWVCVQSFSWPSWGLSCLSTAADCSAQQSQSCVLRSLRSWMVNVATKPWRLISAGRTAALQPRSSAGSLFLCGATSSTPGGIPPMWHQFNEMDSSQCWMGWSFLVLLHGQRVMTGPQRFKGEGRWWLFFFFFLPWLQGLYHLAGPPSTSTWGDAHFATRMGLSVAEGEHKEELHPATGGGWWRRGSFFSLPWFPKSPSCWFNLPSPPTPKYPNRTKMSWKLAVPSIWQMLISCITCIASLIYFF